MTLFNQSISHFNFQRIIVTLSVTLLFSTFTSCDETIDYAVISVSTKNFDKNVLTLYGVSNTETAHFKKEINLEENGSASDTIRLIKSGHYLLFGKNLYIEPGHNLNISFDAKNFNETLKYEGTGAEINNYLAAKYLKEKEVTPKWSESAKLNETEYIKLFSNIKSELNKLAEPLKNTHPEFYKNELKAIDYSYLYELQSYESNYANITENENFKATNKIKDSLIRIDYDIEEDYNFSPYYRILSLRKFLNYSHYPQVTDLDHKDTISQVFKAIKSLKSKNIKNGLASYMTRFMTPSVKNIDLLNDGVLELLTDSITKTEVAKTYAIAKRLSKGQVAPSFNYQNIKGGTTSLSDLKGKYVYVDMWATWCGPCKKEIPYLEEIEKQYHGKNVQFVSISIDSNKEAWEKFVNEKQLGGLQLLADGAGDATILKDYNIEGIPRFMLFDTEGKIIDVNAPQPSDSNLPVVLNALLDNKS